MFSVVGVRACVKLGTLFPYYERVCRDFSSWRFVSTFEFETIGNAHHLEAERLCENSNVRFYYAESNN